MKVKDEKGFTGIDVAIALVIFMLASSVILTMYYNLYVNTVTIKIHETAIAVVTDIFEKIDLESYDNITDTRVAELITSSGAYEYFDKEKNHSNITYSLQKYSEENLLAQDLVMKINLTIKYQINGTERQLSLNKIKIRE